LWPIAPPTKIDVVMEIPSMMTIEPAYVNIAIA
jgi:hypothetical protein